MRVGHQASLGDRINRKRTDVRAGHQASLGDRNWHAGRYMQTEENIKDFNSALEFNDNLESLIFLFGHRIEEYNAEQICEDISSIINDLGFSKKIK